MDRETVMRIAALARLRLDRDEVERLTAQLNDILRHVEALGAVDVAGVEGGAGAVGVAGGAAPLREDVPGADPLARPPAELAPAWMDGFFTVPRLAALDAPPEEGA
jgi:aspartyl-tRNA(Asn)/glutamyl-tRNA(Gln) amidotransferase subunit C